MLVGNLIRHFERTQWEVFTESCPDDDTNVSVRFSRNQALCGCVGQSHRSLTPLCQRKSGSQEICIGNRGSVE